MSFCKFQAVKFSQSRENEKDLQKINIPLAEVLHPINPFGFAPALTLLGRLYNKHLNLCGGERSSALVGRNATENKQQLQFAECRSLV